MSNLEGGIVNTPENGIDSKNVLFFEASQLPLKRTQTPYQERKGQAYPRTTSFYQPALSECFCPRSMRKDVHHRTNRIQLA